MHLFLTGKVRVGKSTIVQQVLQEYRGTVGGFRTILGPLMEDGGSDVFMIDINESKELGCRPENRVARRIGTTKYEGFPEAFDRIGTALLRAAQGKDLIVMDELGFMESEAHEFQQAVIDCLDGTIPILGVVKPASTPFLEQVHKHFHTTLMEVTEQNREHVLREAQERVFHPQYA
ncbi:MAG: nucleoside-triphosphatase [Oscillospiraceae bacterium]|jgi:nucleoside-triphosphatase|nr:nucleoside-triphosphatase [Oscillospiraceae bacterium]